MMVSRFNEKPRHSCWGFFLPAILALVAPAHSVAAPWVLVDNFETDPGLERWTAVDAQNDTNPHVPNPQILEVREEPGSGNHFMIRKPAADDIVGNRKAIGFVPLPTPVQVGETFTFYTRVNVEYFPNNHSFGLANVPAADIPGQHYDAFEPMLRITDKYESDGYKNDGTLMVLSDYKTYSKIVDPTSGEPARPLEAGTWYELWYVVDNAPQASGGQRYDVYIKGGEFDSQQLVYAGAQFRMRRESPLQFFMTICNTGPADAPYGNGGVRYDDIYMAAGRELSSPLH